MTANVRGCNKQAEVIEAHLWRVLLRVVILNLETGTSNNRSSTSVIESTKTV